MSPARIDLQAEQCLTEASGCIEHLSKHHKISIDTIQYAINSKTLGYTCETSDVPPGETGHGGAAAVFIARQFMSCSVNCLDYLYFDPALNGGIERSNTGKSDLAFWSINHGNLKAASTVVLVKNPLTALSIEAAITSSEKPLKGWTVLALIDPDNLESKDWKQLDGKRILLALENDYSGQYPPPWLVNPGKIVVIEHPLLFYRSKQSGRVQ